MQQSILLEKAINFRDLGGLKNKRQQAIKPQKLFRSGDFSLLTESDLKTLNDKIDIILDYRDLAEVKKNPDKKWQKAIYFNVPANPLTTEASAAIANENKSLQQELAHFLKKQNAEKYMLTVYEHLPFNNKAYLKLVDLLANQNGQSLVQHCAVGKDRTGAGVALTLLILDFDEETIIQDYLQTEKGLAAFRTPLLEKLKPQLTPSKFEEYKLLFSARLNFIQTFFDVIHKKYATFDDWLLAEYGVDKAIKREIQSYFLEDL